MRARYMLPIVIALALLPPGGLRAQTPAVAAHIEHVEAGLLPMGVAKDQLVLQRRVPFADLEAISLRAVL